MASSDLTRIGLAGLAVTGQNLALNIAEKGFPISVYNRSSEEVDETVERAKVEGNLPVKGFHDPKDFVNSIQKPRVIILLVKAGLPVDKTRETLCAHMEDGDCIVKVGNEWYENTERRQEAAKQKGLMYLGMGVSGGEEGARHGPSLMPGGSFEAYKYIEDILLKVAAQVDSGPCVTNIGKGGAGNFVKMVHNGIEYGDMQLIAEAYDVLKSIGKLTNEELLQAFDNWNKGELCSFLVEITGDIFGIKDDKGDGHLVDKVLDKTDMKGTGKWAVQQAADLSVAEIFIKKAYDRNPDLFSVLVDPQFAKEMINKLGTSLHAIPSSQTLQIKGFIKDFPVVVLIDTGSTSNFIHQEVAEAVHYFVRAISPFQIQIADGGTMKCEGYCENVELQMEDYQLKTHMFAIDMGDCRIDIILGVEWLRTLGPITMDFQNLYMKFTQDNEHTLHGLPADIA